MAAQPQLSAAINAGLRKAILAAADSRRVKRLVRRHGMRLGGRFVAGETLDECIAVLRRLNEQGLAANTTLLGEGVLEPSQTEAVVAAYRQVIDRIAAEGLNANVALKLTHLGLEIDEDLAFENLRELLEQGSFIRIDMEQSQFVDATLRIYRRLREAGYDNVGTVLQAYLYRTPADLESLLDLAPNLRLVKGAYLEPKWVAHPRKEDVDLEYARLLERMLDAAGHTAIATHDEALIKHAVRYADDHTIDRSRFEFQMLYGVRPQLQLDLVRRGYKVLVATPYGPEWYPYLMRRLGERPANLLFFLKNTLRGSGGPMISRVTIQGYRGARDVVLEPGHTCVLVGESSSGKSTVLSAIWTLLDAAAPMPTGEDVSRGHARVHVEAVVGDRTLFLDARPPATLNLNREGAPHTLFFPAQLRPSTLLAPTDTPAKRAIGVVRDQATTDGGLSLIRSVAGLLDARARGLVVLIEEPELYLTPPAQRHLHRLLRQLAARGRNQVLYSTHAPVFLGVDRLDELVLVRHDERTGTTLLQPKALPERRTFRLVSELDAERAEIFLSRAVLLVEGRTEKLAFPFVFQALGFDADQEAIAVVDCGGKGNIPLFVEICNACGIPYVVVHDRDAPRGVARLTPNGSPTRRSSASQGSGAP